MKMPFIIREKTFSCSLPYRPCAGMMIFNSRGLVWAGQRKSKTGDSLSGETLSSSPNSFLWQMPQGGIDEGENPLDAARREIYEETGMQSLHLLAEAPFWITYDVPEEISTRLWEGKYKGQIQRWFAFSFYGNEDEIRISPHPAEHETEFDAWAWHAISDLPGLVVPFKREVYSRIVKVFGFLERKRAHP